MKKASQAVHHGVLAALAASALLFASCTIAVTPMYVPPVQGLDTPSLADVSVIVTNVDKGSSAYTILNEKGQNLGFVGNRQVWSKKLVEALASELAKRGATVRATAPLTLSIAVPQITMNETRDVYQFKLKAAVASSTGWSKEYEAVAETKRGPIESAEVMAERLAGLSLTEAVKTMLGDAEFLSQLSGKK